MKESRLFKIVYSILDRGHVTAKELAREFEVSVRTIYRDIDALSEAGIPVYAEAGRNGGIAFLDHFVLDKVFFSEKEKKNILSNMQSLLVIDHIDENEVLLKLSALFHVQSENWFEVDFSRWGKGTEDNKKFEELKSAIINHRTVTIDYVDSYGGRSKRNINPLKFFYKAKEWYIKAYCIQKDDFRTFKFNRILELEITKDVFDPMEFREVIEEQPKTYHTIRLRFSKEMAYRVYDEFKACEIIETQDGSLLVTTEMPEDAWLVGYILSFGTQIQVLEPSHLQELVAHQAKKIYEMYKC